MKKYCVYLDESGDFSTDNPNEKKRNPSQMGGFYYKSDNLTNIVSFKNTIKTVIGKENHATEISDDKGVKVYNILTSVKKYPITFVIFQNDKKIKFVDSTRTYLTVATEGLVQLLKKLVILENEPVEIEAVIGWKKDTTIEVTNSSTEGYIGTEQYKQRLEEKISVEKAKLKGSEFFGSTINIYLEDDKRNMFLVLCDCISNFWYTRQSKAFKEKIEINKSEQSIRKLIEDEFDNDYILPLFNSEENEHVLRMVQDGVYADALFEVCAGMLTDESVRRIKEGFLKLTPKHINHQLQNLADYIGDLISFNRSEKLIPLVLEEAEKLYCYISEHVKIPRFYLDIQLYKLAYLNNTGQLEKMERIFEEVKPSLIEYVRKTMDFNYLLIYSIRKAVYLQDVRKYNESKKVCEELELFLMSIEESVKENGLFEVGEVINSEQLGKVLGTKLQAMIPLVYMGEEKYETAKELSDRAIEQFIHPIDLKRQYQYRAQLEAVRGNQEEAIYWIEKSFGGMKWKERLTSKDKNIYDIYNLLYVAAFTKDIEKSISLEIANSVYTSLPKSKAEKGAVEKICDFYMGFVMIGDKKYDNRGVSILKNFIIVSFGNVVLDHYVHAAESLLKGNKRLELFYNK